MSVVFCFLAFNGVLDVDDLFLRCLEISNVSQRRTCIADSILSRICQGHSLYVQE